MRLIPIVEIKICQLFLIRMFAADNCHNVVKPSNSHTDSLNWLISHPKGKSSCSFTLKDSFPSLHHVLSFLKNLYPSIVPMSPHFLVGYNPVPAYTPVFFPCFAVMLHALRSRHFKWAPLSAVRAFCHDAIFFTCPYLYTYTWEGSLSTLFHHPWCLSCPTQTGSSASQLGPLLPHWNVWCYFSSNEIIWNTYWSSLWSLL